MGFIAIELKEFGLHITSNSARLTKYLMARDIISVDEDSYDSPPRLPNSFHRWRVALPRDDP